MNNEAPQKLQRDGMEREARELVWRDAFDDCTIEQWYELIKSLEEDKCWAGGKHRGDCTNAAFTCNRCIYDDIVKRAEPITSFAARCANEARLEALEQAAEIADDADTATTNEANCAPYDHADAASATFYSGEANTAIEIAAAIRALKAAQHGEKELRKGK